MKHTHILGIIVGGISITKRIELGGDNTAEQNFDLSIPSGQTWENLSVEIIANLVLSFAIISDQNIVVKTNDAGEPDNVFTVEANKPFLYRSGTAFKDTNGDDVNGTIERLFVTNSSEDATASVKIFGLINPID